MWVIGFLQIVVPVLLLATVALARQPSRMLWTMNALSFGVVLGYMWLGARWDIVSVHVRTALPIFFLLAVVVGYQRYRTPEEPPGRAVVAFGVVVSAALIVFMGGLSYAALTGYSVPDEAVDLASPLRAGRYVVLHGGASPLINGHARVRPQNYALDIVELDALGMRAKAFVDRADLSGYFIFGATLYSPCGGTVTAAVDEYAGLAPPETDREHLAGNHVLIECEGVEVLLAHMRRGSLRVAVGDAVATTTVLGQVGNTGNTSEPHLHLHAERGGEPGVALDGQAVPITINGRFLVRGDIVKERAALPIRP